MPKINYINDIKHDSAILQGKINYFVDCLDLLTHSLSFPLCSIKLDAKLLCKAFKQILDSSNNKKYENINHYYFHYKKLLDPESIINEKYKLLLGPLNDELQILESLPHNDKKKFDSTNLSLILDKLLAELESSYLLTVLHELKTAVFCAEDIDQHNHKFVIEECSKIIIAEFYNIGFTKDRIQKIFSAAITYKYENFNDLTPSQIREVPVPPEIYVLQKTKSSTVYKNLVKKHLKSSNLETQFNNVFYIFNQAQRDRKFVFKIRNLAISAGEQLEYNGVVFSNSFKEKYASGKGRKAFKDFFNIEQSTAFCEISIRSGYLIDALQKATIIVQDCLNFIHNELGFSSDDGLRKPYLDISEYVLIDLITSLNKRYDALRYDSSDNKYLEYIFELEYLKSNKTVNNYLKVDKIFFQATSSLDRPYSVSEMWRYCEALFDVESESHKMIQRLINYYCAKAPYHIYIGVQQMIYLFEGRYHHGGDEKIASLGLDRNKFWELTTKKTNIGDYVNEFNAIIRHPIINNLKATADSLSPEVSFKTIKEHYYKILKGANINRNLYQHSNVVIDEIVNLWYDQFEMFVGSLRHFIIKDLKSNPTIDKVEDLFPQFLKEPRVP